MYATHTTDERHGYSVQFSTFECDRLLLATSQLYGLAGGGTLFLFQLLPNKGLSQIARLEWSDGLFDVAWCPYANNIAATASGDGSIQIWTELDSQSASSSGKKPALCLREHKNEVYSVDWSEKWNYHQILSSSWDGTVKLWDCNRLQSVATYIGKPLMTIPRAHDSEILALDWSQFDRNVLVTGGADGLVRVWDLRNMRQHVLELFSGEFAVRRLAFSPHKADVLASANYDFTTRIWDFSTSLDSVEIHEHHTEFVCGLDWNSNYPNQLADCGWDSVVNVFTPKSLSM